ncbi:MAG: retropepsin-like aspartic protease [Candidatus Omnitrophota bacterium]
MAKRMKIVLGLFLALALAAPAYADTLYLKNGRSLEGLVKSDNGNTVELEVGASSSVTFLKSEIDRIVKSSETDSFLLRGKWEKRKLKADKKITEIQIEEKEKTGPVPASFSNSLQAITVSVKLNGKVSAGMVLDTGASLVMITKKIAQELGIDLSGVKPDLKALVVDGRKMNAKRVIIESMEVQGVVAKKVEAAVLLDDAGVSGFGDGLLGMSFLKRFNFKVDQKEKKLTFEKL